MDAIKGEQFYQKIVYDIWKEKLPNTEFSIDDNFFDLGGSSLQAIDIIEKLSENFQVDIPQFFANPTIRGIAVSLTEDTGSMKRRFLQTFQFEKLKRADEKEVEEYKERYLKINDVKKQYNKYKNILLLGSTGFLGIYLLNQLLAKSSANIILIVRAESLEQARSRVCHQYEYYFGKDCYKNNIQRIKVIVGDLKEDKFGLADKVYNELAELIDAIINSAALVKHMGRNLDFETTNVKIVKNIIDFADNKKLKDIHHMSTIGIIYGANLEKEKTIFTEYDEITDNGLTNQYLLSKLKAENILIKAREKGIRSNIYRMSGILFDSKSGKYQRNINESAAYIFYRNLYKLGLIPADIQRKMDISCVDKISEAVISLIFIEGHWNEVYHVINPNGLLIQEILNLIQECEGNKEKVLRKLSVEEIYNYYKQAEIEEQKLLKQLVFECEIVSDIGKSTVNIRVDKTVHILEQIGFQWKTIGKEEIMLAYQEMLQI